VLYQAEPLPDERKRVAKRSPPREKYNIAGVENLSSRLVSGAESPLKLEVSRQNREQAVLCFSESDEFRYNTSIKTIQWIA
jgi:hypothetical protein